MNPPVLTASILDRPGVSHGFGTRAGGVSGAVYQSLNCGLGSADARDNVMENRARLVGALGGRAERLATPHQVHSARVTTVDEVWAPGAGPEVDALVTDRPGIAIGVGSADCGPILFADAEAGVVGAAHAGWRGAFTGVIEAAVEAMERLGARRERIAAALGPTISGANYEVGEDFRRNFEERNPENGAFFSAGARPGHAMFDLPAYIMRRLGAAGVGATADLALCTYADENRFFSYRRMTHRGETDYGRHLSAILIDER